MKRDMIKKCATIGLALAVTLSCPVSSAYASVTDDSAHWAELSSWLSSINGYLNWIYSDQMDIKGYVDGLEAGVTSVSGGLEDIWAEASSANSTLNHIYEEVQAIRRNGGSGSGGGADVTTIEGQLEDIWAELSTISSNTGHINDYAANIDNNLQAAVNNQIVLNNNLVQVKEFVDEIEARVSTISNIVNTNSTRLQTIATNTGRLTTTNSTLTNIYNKLNDISTKIGGTTTINGNVTADFSGVESRLDDINSVANDIADISDATQVHALAIYRMTVTIDTTIKNTGTSIVNKLSDVISALNNLNIPNITNLEDYVWTSTTYLDEIGDYQFAIKNAIEKFTFRETDGQKRLLVDVSGNTLNYSGYLNDILTALDAIPENLDEIMNAMQAFFDKFTFVTRSGATWLNTQPSGNVGGTSTGLGTIFNTINSLKTVIQNGQYTGGIFKVHDEGIYEQIGDMQTAIVDAINGLARISTSPDAPEIVGEIPWDDVKQDGETIASRVANLAPFAAFTIMSAELGTWSQVFELEDPTFTLPFHFFGEDDVSIHMSQYADAKPLIHFLMISMLLWCIGSMSVRVVEMEATR